MGSGELEHEPTAERVTIRSIRAEAAVDSETEGMRLVARHRTSGRNKKSSSHAPTVRSSANEQEAGTLAPGKSSRRDRRRLARQRRRTHGDDAGATREHDGDERHDEVSQDQVQSIDGWTFGADDDKGDDDVSEHELLPQRVHLVQPEEADVTEL